MPFFRTRKSASNTYIYVFYTLDVRNDLGIEGWL
jgi:hypothetical protein